MERKVQWKRICCRGIATFALAFALLLLADDLASVSLAVSAGKVTADAANIRKEPSTSSAAIKSAVKKDKVEILGQIVGADGKVWYQIYVNGTDTGYIRSDLVKITDGSTPPSIEASITTTPAPETPGVSTGSAEVEQVTPVGGKVSGSNTVRVRTSPSTANSNNILTTVNSGTEVTVVGKTTGDDKMIWYQIKFTADKKEVIGYIRSDYLKLSGELKPLGEAETPAPADTATPAPDDPGKQPSETEKNKRYETKLISEKWYILDYQAGQQYEIEKLFTAVEEYKELYEESDAKARSRRVWMFIFAFLAIGLFVCAAYLIYRLKECKEEAFIASIENNTMSSRDRTAERPRTENRRPSGERPVIREGMGSQRANGQRPSGAQGQRPQGQRPAGAQRADGQRPAGPQGQRPAGAQGQRPAGANGQRPAGPQGQRSSVSQGNQRPANPISQRPSNPQTSQRVNPAGERPKSKNFVENDGDFEVLNWDSDEE